MSLNNRYFELCYKNRIHEFYKIDQYKNWAQGQARMKYKSLDDFYQKELSINRHELIRLRSEFKYFNDLYKL